MISKLPQSWSRKDLQKPNFHFVRLPLSKLLWIPFAEIPFGYGFNQVYDEYLSGFLEGFVIRGCSAEISEFLNSKNSQVLQTGAEGVIDLSELDNQKSSVSELVRRGRRWGNVREISRSARKQIRIAELRNDAYHSGKQQLKNLFRTKFDSTTRSFVFSTTENNWLGAITISSSEKTYSNLEMILRRINSPVGIMEALIVSAAEILKEEGHTHFSLGEVPFVSPTNNGAKAYDLQTLYYKEKLFYKAGHTLGFAFNYKGLFRFKDKFSPDWKPLYICAKPNISTLVLFDLFLKTRYLNLAGSEFLSQIKKLPSKLVYS